ncbi:hypothetical protein R75461_07639 [Paraburkholderia nemoris]|uniref:T6SS immunity protein Tli3 family protein n=1 Tax=Paraburkholderia nemoris TaxID=2793076 RepID=UPI00190D7B4A|nr:MULTISPECIES: hypothetical protein [Paraburkholderia]MBK3786411.1 hypothetical protein [Paraburkholderia aspalathi]CAE6854495.1 hypothetical protein R75461_07639 [Paraburkholderia nemoris]
MNILSVCRVLVTALIAGIALPGCTTDLSAPSYQKAAEEPHYDGPPKVIYRIDDHRFVSLENYDRCYGDTYYNNTRLGIRHKLARGGGIVTYLGRLIIDDPTEMNVVIPSAPGGGCSSRGCNASLVYSTDGGNTFHGMYYIEGSQAASKDSERYTIAVTKDKFYVAERSYNSFNRDLYVKEYPLVRGIDFDQPYPPGVHGRNFAAPDTPTFPVGIRTPSGQDRFICDMSVSDGTSKK